MSKKRRPPVRQRAASRARGRVATRAVVSRRPKAKRKPRPRPKDGGVYLKPIRNDIKAAIEGLQRLPPTDASKITIERLQRCVMEFDAICEGKGNDGCGPDMAFPAP